MADKLIFKNIERTENLQRYLDEIKKYDVLTPEQEYEYIVKAKAGDMSARDMLVNCNQRYIYSLCKKYSTTYNVLDLVSIAKLVYVTFDCESFAFEETWLDCFEHAVVATRTDVPTVQYLL